MNKTIHELNSLSQAEATDELIVYDVSEGESKKIQVQALNNPNYSTTEQKTGGTWIDGKPIYRRVIDTDISQTLASISADTIVSQIVYFKHDNRILPGGVAGATPYAFVEKNSSNVLILTANPNQGVQRIILEYTKAS